MSQPSLFGLQPNAAHPPERVFLIDGHHLAYRSYFAHEALSTSRGEPTQAIYGFMRTLIRLLAEDGHCVIVVFDPPTPTFRHETFAEYKAGRAATPPDLPHQIDLIRQLVDLLGLSRLEVPGYEADDVIGTLARLAEAQGLPVRIVTGDRDAFQLLSDAVWVMHPDGNLMTPARVQEKYGVSVQQWVDYRALTGDTSDNIPGARGIGPKTAVKLLQQWGSLERLLANLDQVTPDRIRNLLHDSLANIELSRHLSEIHTTVPLPAGFTIEGAHRREVQLQALRQLLEQLEFGSFLRDLGLLEALPTAQEADWPPPAQAWLGYRLSQPQPAWAELTGLGAAWQQLVYRPPQQPWPPRLPMEQIQALDAKNLAVVLQRLGQPLPPHDDPLLLAYLIDPANLDAASVMRRYAAGNWPDDPAEQALAAQNLWEILWQRMQQEPRLWQLYLELERPLSVVLAAMEARGVALDTGYLRQLQAELQQEIQALETQIHQLAGQQFNLNSRDQLERVLYDDLGLQASGKKTTTGKRSTAASALEGLLDRHPIVAQILQYRELVKLSTTYLEPLPRLVHPQTGRLHTRFNQTVTATGRLSSSDPNLQNIPVRTELGRRIRRAFVAQPGYQLVVADYSQIELRVLAHLSDDPNLKQVFLEDRDIHTQTAAWMFGLAPEQVQPQQRRAAKTVVFGVLYGMGAHRLAGELQISFAEAEQFIERYFQSYPMVRAWIHDTLETARQRGYVETMWGRRRFVSDLNAANRNIREAAERMAFNMPIQGTAADLIKRAMVKLAPLLPGYQSQLLLQVHDELVLEAPQAQVESVAKLLVEVMGSAERLAVPLKVGVGIGANWLDAK